jgi:hypothetical protein
LKAPTNRDANEKKYPIKVDQRGEEGDVCEKCDVCVAERFDSEVSEPPRGQCGSFEMGMAVSVVGDTEEVGVE